MDESGDGLEARSSNNSARKSGSNTRSRQHSKRRGIAVTPQHDSRFATALRAAKSDELGAFISTAPFASSSEPASECALNGIPFAVKDNIDTVDLPTTANTPALAGSVPALNNPVVQRLLDAGAQLVGKTNLHELAFGITTGAAAHPASRNPFDPTCSPGGSSGGSAAAVADGIVPFALATDTGGSISIPSAWCGVYGYRPSLGRWPAGGTVPLSASRDAVGVIAESLPWLDRVDATVTGRDSQLSTPETVRLGIPQPDSRFLSPLEGDIQELWDATLAALRTEGRVELVEVETNHLHELDEACGLGVVLYETARDLSQYLTELPTPLSFEEVSTQVAAEDVRAALAQAWGMRNEHETYSQLLAQRAELREAWGELFNAQSIDGLLYPTTPISPVPVGHDVVTTAFGKKVPTFNTVIRNTGPGSLAAQPAITIPVGLGSTGLPVGLSLTGTRNNDDTLFGTAEVVDSIVGDKPLPNRE